jgi:hypothetical protein
MFEIESLGSFRHFAALNAARAHFHSAHAALGRLNANGLQIGIENTRCSIVGMRNIIAKLRAFAANVTTLSHDY